MTAFALVLCQPIRAVAQLKVAEVPQEAHDQAQQSLPVLRQMVTPGTYKKLGFLSVDEATRASLGTPLRVFMVQLDKLKAYQPETKVEDMLVDTNAVRYAVTVDGQARTSVVMRQVEGKWQVARVGRPLLTQALSGVAQRLATESPAAAGATFEVEIPALNLYFIGRQVGSSVMLAPAVDDARFDLKQGVQVEAQQLFSKIAPYAKELKTGPYISD
jgi:hypothetical protein